MTMHTWHIDPLAGDDAADGLSPEHPLRGWAGRVFAPGDQVLFRRGRVMRGYLEACSGAPDAPITYGAYGDGGRPVFLGSQDVGAAEAWVEERPMVWRYTGRFPSEVCNVVFDGGRSCATLCWEAEALRVPGDWHYTAIGGTIASEGGRAADLAPGILYLCSNGNPGMVWSSIEAVLWGQRRLASGTRHIVFQDLAFRNAGVHGYQESGAVDITIRGCEFTWIGGAVWDRAQRIRFGNAIEYWDGASRIRVEDCRFASIFDSGVTHQGGGTRNVPHDLRFTGNLFLDCGMAAYECREPSRDVLFAGNTCLMPGHGFGLQGEAPPRRSEVYPHAMGHHVFIWHIDPGTQTGTVMIRGNVFGPLPHGAAIYSLIGPADERPFILDGNRYLLPAGTLLARFAGRCFTAAEFESFRASTGQERDGYCAAPQ